MQVFMWSCIFSQSSKHLGMQVAAGLYGRTLALKEFSVSCNLSVPFCNGIE